MIIINQDKAIEVAKNRIRVRREAEFKKNDLDIQNALVDGIDTTEFIKRRDYLRDLTNQCNSKTVEELKTLMIDLGV